MSLSPRQKALDYLLAHCRQGQRTKNLFDKRAFVDLEIELTSMREATTGGAVVPMAASFARRDEDPEQHQGGGR